MAVLMAMMKPSDGDFGSRMRLAREQRGISLREIAESTKLSVSALEALERDDISRLPGGIFSRGFVRSYAAEIGVDPETAVREFLSQFPDDSIAASGPHNARADGAPAGISRGLRAMMIVTTIVLVAAAILFWSLK